MRIREVMKTKVVTVEETASLGAAVALIVEHRIGILPVLGPNLKLVGVLGLRDILSLCLPSSVALVNDLDFVGDFGAFEFGKIERKVLESGVTKHMQPVLAVPGECGLLKAHAFMRQHDLSDLPVVDPENRLVGIASWVDVGVGFLKSALADP